MTEKILIVEDNDNNRRLLRDVLEFHGYKIIEAQNGEVGVREARAELPDLILMDVQMPVMDGITAAKLLKADPATRNIKMVALTSFAMAGDRERFLAAGFDDYVAKPIDTRRLPEIVRRFLMDIGRENDAGESFLKTG